MARSLPPMNPLRVFEAAARHLSYTRAAQELHVSQVAVSRQVKVLEAYLEVPLFERRHQTLTLTPDGARLYATVHRALNDIAGTTSSISRRWRRDTLVIQAYTTFAQRWLIPLIPHFHAAFPDIELRLLASTLSVDFERQQVDAAIRSGQGDWPGLVADFLVPLDLVPVASPALLKESPGLREPADLAGHTLLHSLARPDDWSAWLEAAGLPALRGQGQMRFESSVLAYEAALQGVGLAIGIKVLVANDLASGALVAPFGPRHHRLPGGYYLVRPKGGRDTEALRCFREWLLTQPGCGHAAPELCPIKSWERRAE